MTSGHGRASARGHAVLVVDRAAAERALAGLVHAGWREMGLRALPEAPWDLSSARVVVQVEIGDEDDAATTVRARKRGATVVLTVPPGPASPDGLVARTVRDLRRLGPVDDRTASGADPTTGLDREQVTLLLALAGGAPVAEAAAAVHLSVRTAHRRLEAARHTLGAASSAAAAVVVSATVERTGDAGSTGPVLERDAVVAAVERGMAAGPVVVTGARGAGVTTVLDELAHRSGAFVVNGLDLLGDRPFAPFSPLLGAPGRPGRASVGTAVVDRLAGRALLVDDAALLDVGSWGVVHEVARSLPVVLGTTDDGDGSGLRTVLDAFEAEVVEVPALTEAAADDLVQHLVAGLDDARRSEIVHLAGGNPRAIVDLATAPDREQAIEALLAPRVAGLAPGARRLLARIAVDEAPLDDAASPDAEEHRVALLADGLVTAHDDGLTCLGPGVAGAVRRLVGTAAVAEAHAWRAERSADPLTAAGHWLEAGDHDRAHVAARLAATTAGDGPRHAEALALAARTAPAEDVELLGDAARALALHGRMEAGLDLLGEATPGAGTTSAARRLVDHATILAGLGRTGEALELVDARRVPTGVTTDEAIALRSVEAMVSALHGHPTDPAAHPLPEPPTGSEEDLFPTRLITAALHVMNAQDGWADHVLPVLDEAFDRQAADLAIAAEVASQGFLLFADPRQARAVLDRVIAHLRARREAHWAGELSLIRATNRVMVEGPSDRALASLAGWLRDLPIARGHGAGAMTLAVGLADRGRLDEARTVIARANESVALEPNAAMGMRWAAAEVDLAAGRPTDARTEAETIAVGPASTLPTHPMATATAFWAELDGGGRTTSDLPRSPFPILASLSFESTGLRALSDDDPAAAVDAFEAALARPALHRDRLRQRWALGESLRRAERDDEADVVLQALEQEATGQDLVGLSSRIHRSRRLMGRVRARRGAVGVLGLTARETELVGLVAEGGSSAAIAARLHIAPSTVDATMRSVMRKLGVSTRRQAAAMIAPHLQGDDGQRDG